MQLCLNIKINVFLLLFVNNPHMGCTEVEYSVQNHNFLKCHHVHNKNCFALQMLKRIEVRVETGGTDGWDGGSLGLGVWFCPPGGAGGTGDLLGCFDHLLQRFPVCC